MKHSTRKPTKAEAKRMAAIKGMVCLACALAPCPTYMPTEVHHLLSGNKRRGHLCTVPLCVYHHRGIRPTLGMAKDEAEELFGPSLALSSRHFRERFGNDDELLARTDALLGVTA